MCCLWDICAPCVCSVSVSLGKYHCTRETWEPGALHGRVWSGSLGLYQDGEHSQTVPRHHPPTPTGRQPRGIHHQNNRYITSTRTLPKQVVTFAPLVNIFCQCYLNNLVYNQWNSIRKSQKFEIQMENWSARDLSWNTICIFTTKAIYSMKEKTSQIVFSLNAACLGQACRINFLRITSLSCIGNFLWIGTNVGVIVSLPVGEGTQSQFN